METIGTLSLIVLVRMPGTLKETTKTVYTERGITFAQADETFRQFKLDNPHLGAMAKFTPDSVWL